MVCRVCRSRNAATILHPDVAQFTVDPVPGIINHSAPEAGSAHSEFSAEVVQSGCRQWTAEYPEQVRADQTDHSFLPVSLIPVFFDGLPD
jgi:hypothetical protein